MMCRDDDGASEVAAALDRARAVYAKGDTEKAEAEYRRAMAMNCPDSEAAYQLGAILEGRGDYAAAGDAYRIAVAQGDDNAPVELASLLMDHLDRLGEAEEFVRLGLERGDRRAWVCLGELRNRQGRISEAEEAFRRAIDEGETYGYISLGEILVKKDARGEALREYQQALNDNRAQAEEWQSSVNGCSDDVAVQWFDDVRASVVEALLELGHKAHEARDLDVAAVAYREAGEHGDAYGGPEAAYGLARICEERGDYAEAAVFYEKAIERGDREYAPMDLASLFADELDRQGDAQRLIDEALARGDGRGYVNLGSLRRKEGRYGEAEEALRHALEGGVPYAHLHLAKLLQARGEEDDAIAEYLRCVDDDFGPDGWKHAGCGLLELGSLEAAEGMFRRGLEAGDSKNYRYLGRVLHELGRSDEADHIFEEALAKGQRDVLVEYGIMLRDTGRTAQAEQALHEAVQQGDMDAHYELAELYKGDGRLPEADREYQAAIAADDDEAPHAYGQMLMETGRLPDAESQFKLAIEWGDEEAASSLAALYERMGRHDEADAVRRRGSDKKS